ncbi:hypothetical protein BKK54_02765 [Rodentibacter genomosp. 1]|uniref:Uncharacterized protein n=1 Tax=Rodentibacter genomosp. 1 TaxID=1908264 RepID=A0A1V3J861_9PAST|nr:hypothetical protein [Rodentibacter genomosp. 1]OOF51544.1 hypothetical protein BKK54_02765 [Rodentibacter genomosp. 1]
MFKKFLLILGGLFFISSSFANSSLNIYVEEFKKVLSKDISSITGKSVMIDTSWEELEDRYNDPMQKVRVDIENGACTDYMLAFMYVGSSNRILSMMQKLHEDRSQIPKLFVLGGAEANLFNKALAIESVYGKEVCTVDDNAKTKLKDMIERKYGSEKKKIKEYLEKQKQNQ